MNIKKNHRKTTSLAIILIASLVAVSSTQAQTFTWVGGTSNDWDDTTNWDGGILPPESPNNGIQGGADAVNTVVIQDGTFAPTTNVPAYANSNGDNTTPRFDIQAGASLTIAQDIGAFNGPTVGGDIVTVGAGGSLTWVSEVGFRLSRDPNGEQNYNINGGTFTLDSPGGGNTQRLDFGESENRLVNFNLDGGTFNFTGFRMFGTRNANGTFGTASTVTLANNSVFNSDGFLQGNLVSNTDPNIPTLVFDIQDLDSSVTFRLGPAGTSFVDLAAVEAAEGINWTSSTLGNDSLTYALNGDLVTISASDSPVSMTGDFDADGDVDCDDLDGYVGNIGAAATGALAALDLDTSGFLDATDADTHLRTLVLATNGITGTIPGDADCDGMVNVLGDAFILVANLGEMNATSYGQGDFNFDGVVNVLGDAFILVGNLGSSNTP